MVKGQDWSLMWGKSLKYFRSRQRELEEEGGAGGVRAAGVRAAVGRRATAARGKRAAAVGRRAAAAGEEDNHRHPP
jgi:hypothetical protein